MKGSGPEYLGSSQELRKAPPTGMAKDPGRKSEVWEAVAFQNEANQRLAEKVHELEALLGPVMSCAVEAPDSNAEVTPTRCELATALNREAQKTYTLATDILELITRLRL